MTDGRTDDELHARTHAHVHPCSFRNKCLVEVVQAALSKRDVESVHVILDGCHQFNRSFPAGVLQAVSTKLCTRRLCRAWGARHGTFRASQPSRTTVIRLPAWLSTYLPAY